MNFLKEVTYLFERMEVAGSHKMIIGSALHTDALKPASLLSLTLQDYDINIVQGIKHILKFYSLLVKLTSQSPVKWPVTKVN